MLGDGKNGRKGVVEDDVEKGGTRLVDGNRGGEPVKHGAEQGDSDGNVSR